MTNSAAAMLAPLPPVHVIDDFLSTRDHAELLDLALAGQTLFAPATVNRGAEEAVQREQRASKKLSTALGPLKAMFTDRVREALPILFERTGVRACPVHKLELELVAHNDGDYFGRHIDTLTGKGRPSSEGGQSARLLSAVYYFYRQPRGFSGGELRLYRFGHGDDVSDCVDIIPKDNRFVVFPSFAPHEVLPVSCPSGRFEDSRFSVNCWVHRSV